MGTVAAVCVSEARGTVKRNIGRAQLVENWGIADDAHAGAWHRQVSLLSAESVQAMAARGDINIESGAFGENLLVTGLEVAALPVGTRLRCGEALLEITQIGKQCHHDCAIRQRLGDCVMPREGVFARVLRGGWVSVGEEIEVCTE